MSNIRREAIILAEFNSNLFQGYMGKGFNRDEAIRLLISHGLTAEQYFNGKSSPKPVKE